MNGWEEARRYSALDERDVRIKSLEEEVEELREETRRLKTLNSDLRKARDRAVARLREEERNRAWERTRAEELVMGKDRESAELRGRVVGLEGVLRAAQKDLDFVHGLFASDDVALIENTPAGIWRLDMSNISQKIDAALYRASGQQENQEEDRDNV